MVRDLTYTAVQCQHVSPVREGAVASSCVHLAAVLGHTDTLAYLLARGGQLEARDQAGSTPLMLGIQWLMNGCVKCVVAFVKLRQGSGKDRQGMAVKAKGLKALTLAKSLH